MSIVHIQCYISFRYTTERFNFDICYAMLTIFDMVKSLVTPYFKGLVLSHEVDVIKISPSALHDRTKYLGLGPPYHRAEGNQE